MRWLVIVMSLAACPREAPPPSDAAEKADVLATREALLARREAEMAQREALIAVREQALAIREEAVARRESVAGLTPSERERLRVEAQQVKERVLGMLASQGLEVRDAPASLAGHIERGDALMEGKDYVAAKLAYSASEAYALGLTLDETLLRRRLDEAQRVLAASSMSPSEKAWLGQALLAARGRMADRAYKESLALIKQVEDAAAPSDAKKSAP